MYISKRTCYIERGNANTIGGIYSILCTKHKKLYVGQTRQSLNERFNTHAPMAQMQFTTLIDPI